MDLPNRLYYRFKDKPDTLAVVDCAKVEMKQGHLIVEIQDKLVFDINELEFFDIRPNKQR